MKSAALDTSIVMRLLTGLPEAQAQKALSEFTSRLASGSKLFVSDLVISEAYFALQHHYKIPKPEALQLLSDFLSDSGITSTGVATTIMATPNLATAKPGFLDRLIHAQALDVAEELLTFEKASSRLGHVCILKA